ncbi:2665_t:CDS:2 [Entrophospora sp. SA101]|nr:14603_t:CDS:2 [Entrophospora sp. SA101]CAJ0646892.1 2665_t:CDS:2 [Entrophospora sp. SA101]CAJ0846479.1 2451_t:CDS:2 [Entrophospora sp. SA101]CAJ0886244.1 193_t:CDS:2 [Entrophospora sp. SA101]
MSLEKIYNIFSKEECNSFNYTWVIENFQNFYIYKKVLKIKSDEFTEPKLNNNFLFEEEDLFTPLFITKADKLDYIWQIHLYLNIDVEEKDFISLYLFPIKNNSNRYVKWKFELYKYTSNDDNDEFLEENQKNEEENFELLSRNYEYEHDIFDDDEGWGYEKFCEIKKIFPNFKDYKKTNLNIIFQYMFDNWLEIEKNQETDYLLGYDDGKLIDQLKRVDNSNTIISNTWNLV